MSDLSPLCAPKRTFANVSGLGSLPSEICAMSTNAHSKIGLGQIRKQRVRYRALSEERFAYVIHDLYGVRKAFRLF
jgi:hypothetical protein